MSRKVKRSRASDYQMYTCLYGKRSHARFVKAYCELHKCYLSANNLKEKGCNITNKGRACKHLKEITPQLQPK